MKKLLILIVALAATLAGCDSMDADTPTSLGLTETSGSAQSLVGQTTTLNGYTIKFSVDTQDSTSTKFSYEVTGVNPGPPNLDWFFLENACGDTPILDPSNAVKETVVNGVPGFQWQASVTSSRTYSYTFPGSLETRIVRATISRGHVVETAVVPGPCGGYAIEGSVNAVSSGGAGIPNVLVEVRDDSGVLYEDVTDGRGAYTLLVIEKGAYTVQVPDPASNALNEALYLVYSPELSPASQVIDVDADPFTGPSFVFKPEKNKIKEDLRGEYITSSQGLKFWQTVIRDTSRGTKCVASPYGGPPLCQADVLVYLNKIFYSDGDSEYYLLDRPFELPAGTDAYTHASALLSPPAKTDLEQVAQNLFVMELNRFRGWGTKDPAYDDALMAYLEQYVANPPSTTLSSQSVSTAKVGGGGGGTVKSDELVITESYLLGGGGGGTVQ